MSGQLPSFGVWWTPERSASREASAGGKAPEGVDSLCVFRLSITRTIRLGVLQAGWLVLLKRHGGASRRENPFANQV